MQRMGQESEFKEKLVAINRVTKVVKGGRNFRFAALVVVGDEKGRVGAGIGKGRRNFRSHPQGRGQGQKEPDHRSAEGHEHSARCHRALRHRQSGFCSPRRKARALSRAALRAPCWNLPAYAISAPKSYGTNNRINMVKATLEGLKQLRTAEQIARLRGKTVEEILG